MRFTMARPEVSCHPETLLPGARTVISAALCYYAPEPSASPGEGRLPRYTWFHAYADLREKLDALGRRLGGEYRSCSSTRTTTSTARAAARRGRLLREEHDADHARGTAPGSCSGRSSPRPRSRRAPRSPLDCGSCTLCIEACPTGALDDPGTLDSTRCLSYWSQAPGPIPEEYRAELGAQVYGCDICQDVCPWNRGVEKRRAGGATAEGAEPHVSLVEWLELSDDELRTRYERLYFPRKDPRYLRRNALVALGNSGEPELRPAAEAYAAGDDPLLREHAEWALAGSTRRLDEA